MTQKEAKDIAIEVWTYLAEKRTALTGFALGARTAVDAVLTILLLVTTTVSYASRPIGGSVVLRRKRRLELATCLIRITDYGKGDGQKCQCYRACRQTAEARCFGEGGCE
jgi:hypothetical protein